MLRPEDCKPGVEVIAIKNNPNTFKLSIGMIYTIKSYHTQYIGVRSLEIRDGDVISLNEVAPWNNKLNPAFNLDQFKLRNPDELIRLFNINNIEANLLNERSFENV